MSYHSVHNTQNTLFYNRVWRWRLEYLDTRMSVNIKVCVQIILKSRGARLRVNAIIWLWSILAPPYPCARGHLSPPFCYTTAKSVYIDMHPTHTHTHKCTCVHTHALHMHTHTCPNTHQTCKQLFKSGLSLCLIVSTVGWTWSVIYNTPPVYVHISETVNVGSTILVTRWPN